MPSRFSIRPRDAMSIILLQVCLILLTVVSLGQTAQTQPEPATRLFEADKAHVDAAIAKLKSGDFVLSDVDMIGRGGAVEAIPILKEQFARVQDPLDKAKIAQVLIKLGDKDDTYWDFLVNFAKPALESDAPDFMNFGVQGKPAPGPSPAFIAWAKAHHVPPNGPNGNAAENSVYIFPGEVMLLGGTGDPRAIPLLRRALSSPNHMIEVAAAEGLAELEDKESIPLIIDACKRAPAEAAEVIARSLVYFDDADAQNAVDMYVGKDMAKLLREAKAQGKKTPFTY
jgi:HEAT repeats